MPEPLVEIAEILDSPRPEPQCLADGLCGSRDTLCWPAIDRGEDQGEAIKRFWQRLRQQGDLGASAIAQRDVENPLKPMLFIVSRCARANQDNLGHSRNDRRAEALNERRALCWKRSRH